MKTRLFFSLIFFAKVSLATILPLIVFVLTGRIIDKQLGTSPYFLITGALFALFATLFWLRSLSKQIIKKFNELD